MPILGLVPSVIIAAAILKKNLETSNNNSYETYVIEYMNCTIAVADALGIKTLDQRMIPPHSAQVRTRPPLASPFCAVSPVPPRNERSALGGVKDKSKKVPNGDSGNSSATPSDHRETVRLQPQNCS